MAVTQGHGNPDWSREEILLALDLYLKLAGKVPGPDDFQVVELSNALRQLPIHRESQKNERFRNPAGVAFKLQNIRQIATGQGLGNVSATDRAVWADYKDLPDLVHALATSIREQIHSPEVTSVEVSELPADEEFAEGRLLTIVHKARERSRKVRIQLIRHRRSLGTLSCDGCGDGPKLADSNLDEAGFEAHHVVPLADAKERRTKVKDMALLCATCHRLIHRLISLKKSWVSVDDFSNRLKAIGSGS
jgi:5-methylcytosine-specific restriction protein A